jgi:predicted RND superfamily exporter protein
MLLLTGGLIATSLGVRLDADPFSFFQPESSFAKALRHLSERQFGHYILDVVLVPKHEAKDPAELAEERQLDFAAARAFQDRVKARPEVRNVVSALEIQARMQSLQTLFADFRRAMVFKDMFKNWTVDRKGEGALRITFTVSDSGTGFGEFMSSVQEALPTDRFDVILTGTVASVVALTDGLVGGIARGLSAALVVMALLCYFLFRSIRLTALAFLPNAFPILFIFGLMGAIDIPLNSGSAMVATIALGMGLNDTVHFVMHYRRRRLEGESPDEAVGGTFAEIGRPLIATSTVNCIGFAIFLVSDFRPLYHFGLLSSVAMIAALVGDMVLLPNLLKLFDRFDPQRPRPDSAV